MRLEIVGAAAVLEVVVQPVSHSVIGFEVKRSVKPQFWPSRARGCWDRWIVDLFFDACGIGLDRVGRDCD